jgi:hypothetical protein
MNNRLWWRLGESSVADQGDLPCASADPPPLTTAMPGGNGG